MSSKAAIEGWMRKLYYQHPTWPPKQIIHTAYKQCNATKDDFTDWCPYCSFAQMQFSQKLAETLWTEDFIREPLSLRISHAVNQYLPILQDKYPNLSKVQLLQLAYRLARQVLEQSDFEEQLEENVYFLINIDDPEAFQASLTEDDFTDDNLAEWFKNLFNKNQNTFFAKDQPVASSNVGEVGYEEGKLRVFFRNGYGYEYDVPNNFYTSMISAPSKGRFVWNYLRGRTPGRVIDDPSRWTPGGVGGSLVPYFKIKGARMSPTKMKQSVLKFLKAAKKGKAEAGGMPIQEISRKEYRQYRKFMRSRKGTGKIPAQQPPQPQQAMAGNAPQPPQRPKSPAQPQQQVRQPSPQQPAKKSPKKSPKAKGKHPKPPRMIQKPKPSKKGKQPQRRRVASRLRPNLDPKARIEGRLREKKSTQTETEEEKRRQSKTEDREFIYEEIRKIRAQIKRMRELDLPEISIKVLQAKITKLQKDLEMLSDFAVVDDFVDDMRYFNGPITRAGNFVYGNAIKKKEFENLKAVSRKYDHLPAFNSHDEHQIIGFLFNFTDNPAELSYPTDDLLAMANQNYIFSEGYTFDDVENISSVPLDSETKLPVSIRFLDGNADMETDTQHLTDLIHLAISVDRTDQDRCSTGDGNPCYVQFHDKQDFIPQVKQDMTHMPKDKEKDEEDEQEDEGESESSAKEEKDEKKKENEDFSDTISISKAEYEELQNAKNDFDTLKQDSETRLQKLESDFNSIVKAQEMKEFNKLKSDFIDAKDEVYKIKNDFINSADLKTLQLLRNALVRHDPMPDPDAQLFGGDSKDFSSQLEQTKKAFEDRWVNRRK